MGPDDRLANGTYYLRYTFYHTMTRQENGVDFACHLVHEMPTMSVTASNSLPLIVNCKFVCLTQLSRMEFPTLINWTSPFLFSGLLGGIFHFHSNLTPFKRNGISHYYQLDQSITILRVVGWYFFIFIQIFENRIFSRSFNRCVKLIC